MEWHKHFKGGYRSACGRWSAELHREGWRLALCDGARPYGRWVTVGVFVTLREAKEEARRRNRA